MSSFICNYIKVLEVIGLER